MVVEKSREGGDSIGRLFSVSVLSKAASVASDWQISINGVPKPEVLIKVSWFYGTVSSLVFPSSVTSPATEDRITNVYRFFRALQKGGQVDFDWSMCCWPKISISLWFESSPACAEYSDLPWFSAHNDRFQSLWVGRCLLYTRVYTHKNCRWNPGVSFVTLCLIFFDTRSLIEPESFHLSCQGQLWPYRHSGPCWAFTCVLEI